MFALLLLPLLLLLLHVTVEIAALRRNELNTFALATKAGLDDPSSMCISSRSSYCLLQLKGQDICFGVVV